MRLALLFLLAALSSPAVAADPASSGSKERSIPVAPTPPPPPEHYQPPTAPELPGTGQAEPEITITTKGTEIHEEYRLNGRLYMIKIIPKNGKPYYLIDHEGSGQFRRSEFEPGIAIPTWVIKRF